MRRSTKPSAAEAGDAFGRAPKRVGWSWRHRVFVFVLTLSLAFAVFVLVAVERVRSYAPLCVPSAPPLARASASQLQGLRADLTAVMARADGRVYAAGVVPPSAVWTDDPPEGSSLDLSKDGLGPAGFEIRQWAPDPRFGSAYRDDIVGEVFLFATASQADRFFAEAISTRCRRSGIARPAPRPRYARDVIWFNPDAATEEDVFVVHGRRVYRIVDVRPEGAERPRWSAEQQIGIATVDRLACTIPGEDCPRFAETAAEAVCAFNRELVSLYGERGPWALFPVHRATQALVVRTIHGLRAIASPPAQAGAFGAFVTALERLLALGRQWNAARAAGRPTSAHEYFERAPPYQREFARLGNALGVYECAPIEARRPTA